MGNTGGTGGTGGECGSGGGGGGGGGYFGGHGGRGGNSYRSENNGISAVDLKDSDDTVFIWIKGFVDGKTFIEHVKKAGPIKTNRDTALRMSQMRQSGDMTEGIATYEDLKSVEKIQKGEFNIDGSVTVIPAKDYLKNEDISNCFLTRKPGENTAWSYWRWQTEKHQPRGGQGGQGGSGLFGHFRGQDGEPGGPGRGGQGGRGGRGGGRL